MEPITLSYKAVSQELWRLLTAIISDPAFGDFFLVGGTALSLRLGHRKSEDLDLFCLGNFEPTLVEKHLSTQFEVTRIYTEKNTVCAYVAGIKVDFLAHGYQLLGEVECIDGIRIASLKDLAAMKLNAISGRGLKKDFWDIASLLNLFTLPEMLGYFKTKYALADTWHLLRSLCYFADADSDNTPILNLGQTDWEQVKAIVRKAVAQIVD